MKLKNLTLFDWRSYERAEAAFAPGVNLLVGENAQGKTNLLEAIVYLSQGQSFRTRSQAELVRLGAEFADLQAELFDEERTQSLRAVIFASRRPRQLYVGGVKKKSGADLAGLLPTVLFCPEDLQVLRAGAQARRRLIDHTLCQLRPAYALALLEYGRCLERKGRILKDHMLQPGLLEVLPEYNERMARLGARIIHYRARYVKALDEAARLCHGDFSGGKETLTLEYRSVSNIDDVFASEDVLYDRLREHQKSHARAELESGQCYGRAEGVLGRWMAARGNREQLVVLSKCGDLKNGVVHLDRQVIEQELSESLRQLRTDHIDVYLLHRDDPGTPISEYMTCLNECKAAGKIRCFGVSNWTVARITEANAWAAAHGMEGFSVSSPHYGLAVQEADPWGGGCVTVSGPCIRSFPR